MREVQRGWGVTSWWKTVWVTPGDPIKNSHPVESREPGWTDQNTHACTCVCTGASSHTHTHTHTHTVLYWRSYLNTKQTPLAHLPLDSVCSSERWPVEQWMFYSLLPILLGQSFLFPFNRGVNWNSGTLSRLPGSLSQEWQRGLWSWAPPWAVSGPVRRGFPGYLAGSGQQLSSALHSKTASPFPPSLPLPTAQLRSELLTRSHWLVPVQ